MTIRTRASALLLAAILLLSPTARARGDGATPAPGESQPAASSSAEATPAPEMPYKGDGSGYTYITTDERDREWEEDIVYLADTFLHYLNGHPKLIDRQCLVIRADGDTVGKASMTREYLYVRASVRLL